MLNQFLLRRVAFGPGFLEVQVRHMVWMFRPCVPEDKPSFIKSQASDISLGARKADVESFLDELDDPGFFGAAAETFVQHLLAEAQILRGGFHVFVHVNVF